MRKEFKPGDLALVINATHPENIGKVVELVRATNDSLITMQDGGVVANPNNLKCWEVICGCLQVTSIMRPDGFTSRHGATPEKNLMPLTGDTVDALEKLSEATV